MQWLARAALCVACVFGLDVTSCTSATALQEETPQSTAQVWEGVLDLPRRPVVVTLRLQTAGSAVTGTIQFSGQQLIPMSGTSEGDALTLSSSDPRIDVHARADGATLTGMLTLAEQSFAFQLNRESNLPPPATRSQAWTQDLEIAARKLPLYDRSMSPGEARQYRSALMLLATDIDRMSDAAIIVRLARAVALAQNAHTRLYILRNRTELRRLPIRLWWFGDRVRVVRATAQHADLVGCEVKRIGERSVRAVKDLRSAALCRESFLADLYERLLDDQPGSAVRAWADAQDRVAVMAVSVRRSCREFAAASASPPQTHIADGSVVGSRRRSLPTMASSGSAFRCPLPFPSTCGIRTGTTGMNTLPIARRSTCSTPALSGGRRLRRSVSMSRRSRTSSKAEP